jgi:hypothetical protein
MQLALVGIGHAKPSREIGRMSIGSPSPDAACRRNASCNNSGYDAKEDVMTITPFAQPSEHTAAIVGIRSVVDRRRLAKRVGILVFAGWVSVLPNPSPGMASGRQSETSTNTHFAIPISLLEEHAELYTAFETASRIPGATGAAARRVIALRTAHVAKEQRVAYPLLRLLPLLDKGKAEPWMAELLPLADELRAALPSLKQEHVAITRALEDLRTEAWAEGHPEYAFLAQRLKHHLRVEEEILYPAALVTAECVRGQLSPSQ